MEENRNKEINEFIDYYFLPEHEKLKKDIISTLAAEKDDLIIKLELFDWICYLEEFEKEFEMLWSYLELPKKYDYLFAAKVYLKKQLKRDTVLKILLDFIFLKNRNEEKQFCNNMRKKIEEKFRVYKGIGVLYKMDKDEIENLFSKKNLENEKLISTGKKFVGRGISKYKLEAYELILKKNNEYLEQFGKNNFRTATFKIAPLLFITKDHKEEIEKLYKSFKKFQKDNNIKTLEDFKIFLSTYRK